MEEEAFRPQILEPQAAITVLSPRKETFLLVRALTHSTHHPNTEQRKSQDGGMDG